MARAGSVLSAPTHAVAAPVAALAVTAQAAHVTATAARSGRSMARRSPRAGRDVGRVQHGRIGVAIQQPRGDHVDAMLLVDDVGERARGEAGIDGIHVESHEQRARVVPERDPLDLDHHARSGLGKHGGVLRIAAGRHRDDQSVGGERRAALRRAPRHAAHGGARSSPRRRRRRARPTAMRLREVARVVVARTPPAQSRCDRVERRRAASPPRRRATAGLGQRGRGAGSVTQSRRWRRGCRPPRSASDRGMRRRSAVAHPGARRPGEGRRAPDAIATATRRPMRGASWAIPSARKQPGARARVIAARDMARS